MLDWTATLVWTVLGAATGMLALAHMRRLAGRRPQPRTWERRAWAVALLVAALVYLGFAAAGGATGPWWLIEAAGVVAFGALALASERFGPALLAAGWLGHIAWDAGVHAAVPSHVPAWYVPACVGFDLVVAIALVRLPAVAPPAARGEG